MGGMKAHMSKGDSESFWETGNVYDCFLQTRDERRKHWRRGFGDNGVAVREGNRQSVQMSQGEGEECQEAQGDYMLGDSPYQFCSNLSQFLLLRDPRAVFL